VGNGSRRRAALFAQRDRGCHDPRLRARDRRGDTRCFSSSAAARPSTANLFESGNTIAARIASEFQGAQTPLELASIFYLAAILLVFSLAVNFVAQAIIRRSHRRLGGV
jgi:hypothetical protein